ncbi:MAG: hypothetical protein P8X94_01585 [Woeseiaceae bacterium]
MSFYAELQRRNVIRVCVAYIVTAWVVAQVAEFAFETFGAPDWTLKALVVVLFLSLPLVLIFAWAFEMTPEGLKREEEVDRSESITTQTGRKLDRTIIVVLLIALGWFAWDKFAGPEVAVPSQAARETSEEVAPADEALVGVDKSVAVLPFIAMSNGPDDEYFADGLTEEILNSLAQLPELLVTARTSAFSFKGKDVPVQEIAATLGVRHIVEGSVRRSGERLRVTAQLIRAGDGFHLWSENFDSSSEDVISVQENIAERIALALDVVLDEDKRTVMRRAGLRDVEAFTIYQKGVAALYAAHGDADMITALRGANAYFDRVIERAPEFAQVYVDHSDLFIHMLTNDVVGVNQVVTDAELQAALPAAIEDYRAATRYAPSDAARAMAELDLAFLVGNWRGIGGRLETALNAEGCAAGNWFPVVVFVSGHAGEFLDLSQRLLSCDPLRSLSWLDATRAALWVGNPDQALRIAREGIDVAPSEWLSMALVRALVANGLYDEARATIESRIRGPVLATALQVLVAAHDTDSASATRWVQRYSDEKGEAGNFLDIMVQAWSGNREEANRIAARYNEHHFGPVALWQIANWCTCGAPWDLEATPNFAAKFTETGLQWPPPKPLPVPLKTW